MGLPSLVLLAGCGAAAATGPRSSVERPRVEPRDTHLVHEDCPPKGASVLAEDIDGDGRPDRQSYADAARPTCSTLDFNFDGVIDEWVYLDDAGQVRRREHDFDRDGRVDEVSLYRRGMLVEQRRATARAGKMARTERDGNGDDYVDQWWEYPAPRTSDCPLIHSDVDGDGFPDPGATVDLCPDGNSPGASGDGDPAAVPPSGVGEVPTELEPSGAEAPSGASGDVGSSPSGESGQSPCARGVARGRCSCWRRALCRAAVTRSARVRTSSQATPPIAKPIRRSTMTAPVASSRAGSTGRWPNP